MTQQDLFSVSPDDKPLFLSNAPEYYRCEKEMIASVDGITPIEDYGGVFVKRDDLFSVGGVSGGKARTCFVLAKGARGLVTAGSRFSPQVNIVAHIASFLKIPCRAHTPEGELSPELKEAVLNGAEIIQHKAGYNSVLIRRCKDDAKISGWAEIPFGMECEEAVHQTSRQVTNIPSNVKRIVIPVGSGMSLAGVLTGIVDNGIDIPVVGVRVGADPTKRLDRYAPIMWQRLVTMVSSGLEYDKRAPNRLEDLILDPYYEAKCIPFLQKGDLLWVVGIRSSENRNIV